VGLGYHRMTAFFCGFGLDLRAFFVYTLFVDIGLALPATVCRGKGT
jgi:hypothetical protein